jgi:hypothetical protein
MLRVRQKEKDSKAWSKDSTSRADELLTATNSPEAADPKVTENREERS